MKRVERREKNDSLKLKAFIFSLSFFSFLFSLYSFSAEPTPAQLKNVGIEPRLGNTLPLNLEFTNEAGKTVPLKTYFDGTKPVILALIYYECPNLCTYLLNGTVDALKQMTWTPGQEFQIVAVSIDPKETPELAAKKKSAYLKEYGRENTVAGWSFLIGKKENIDALAESIGFRYAYDPEIKQYAHGAGLFVVTPEGKLARTLFGIQFNPRDVRLALTEASEGKIGTVIDKILLLCYGYDSKASRYVLFATKFMKVGAVLTILGLGFMVSRLGRKKA